MRLRLIIPYTVTVNPFLPSNPSTAGRVTDGHLKAARIVESLFRVTPTTCWDLLLDLRQALLEGWDSSRMHAVFQRCRSELEMDHYLLFYRLRRLLGQPAVAARTSDRASVLLTGCGATQG